MLLSGECGQRWALGRAWGNVLVMYHFSAEFRSVHLMVILISYPYAVNFLLIVWMYIENSFKMQWHKAYLSSIWSCTDNFQRGTYEWKYLSLERDLGNLNMWLKNFQRILLPVLMNHKHVKPRVLIFFWPQHWYFFIDEHSIEPFIWNGPWNGHYIILNLFSYFILKNV